MPSIRYAFVTINSAAVQDPTSDKAGAAVKATLDVDDFEFVTSQCLADGAEDNLRALLKDWADKGTADVIFTVGCTGFGQQERAPEAVNSLIERHASGLVHLLLTASLQHTPFAAVSRPVAGMYKNTLMITLPGSATAVKENLGALLNSSVLQRCVSYMVGVRMGRDQNGEC